MLALMAQLLLSGLAESAAGRKVKEKNIYRTSDVLVSGGFHTVVPKRCVIFIPQNLTGKLALSKPGGTFIMWDKFLSKNHVWLHKMEVTFEEAVGERAIDKAKMKRVMQTGKVVIAVYKNRPVSMLPLKEKKEE